MSLLRSVVQGRNVENPAQPLTSSVLLDWLGKGWQTDAGVAVTPETAMRLTAVYRSVSIVAGTIGSLPLHGYQRQDKKRIYPDVLEDPHPDMTRMELLEFGGTSLLMRGNTYYTKKRNGAGEVKQLWPIHPARVRVGRNKPTEGNPSGKVFVVSADYNGFSGAKDELDDATYLTPHEILHIPALTTDGLVGLSPIQTARQAIGLGLAGETFGARFFGRGMLLSGVLETDQKLNEKDADFVQERWKKKYGGLENAQEVAVLSHGAKFTPITLPARDAQFIETRRFQVAEIARLFGIPPHMLADVERSTSWGTGIEQQNIGMVTWTLRPWLVRIEKRISKECLTAEQYAEFKVEGLLRADTKSRGEYYAKARQWGWMSANDIRELENETPIDGGDNYLVPTTHKVLGSQGEGD